MRKSSRPEAMALPRWAYPRARPAPNRWRRGPDQQAQQAHRTAAYPSPTKRAPDHHEPQQSDRTRSDQSPDDRIPGSQTPGDHQSDDPPTGRHQANQHPANQHQANQHQANRHQANRPPQHRPPASHAPRAATDPHPPHGPANRSARYRARSSRSPGPAHRPSRTDAARHRPRRPYRPLRHRRLLCDGHLVPGSQRRPPPCRRPGVTARADECNTFRRPKITNCSMREEGPQRPGLRPYVYCLTAGITANPRRNLRMAVPAARRDPAHDDSTRMNPKRGQINSSHSFKYSSSRLL
ncbi:hypothetical protein J2S57_000885 [Kineosporia succinea]|uniref:Uncharacterized protein n=1 Tax=Kineosporia succinea TaxID=84632 RepID=A0ABT9NXV4_9ACTN|nr:hypothetical protein [Kineosporia succinea]